MAGSSQIDIVNAALLELGEQPLTALDDDAESAVVANAIYDQVKQDLLAKAPWRFAVKKADLSAEVAAPLNEWTVQFTAPSDLVRLVRVYPDQAYDVYGGKVYANSTSLACDYVADVAEDLFPPYFTRLLVLELAARMCKSITGSESAKQTLTNERQYQFASALSADAMQQPNRPIRSRPYLDVR